MKILEYLGQWTFQDQIRIEPVELGNTDSQCPFKNGHCDKVAKSLEPVCSVIRPDGKSWITCSERLCSSSNNFLLSSYQTDQLYEISKNIFAADIRKEEIFYRRERPIPVITGGNYRADFILGTTRPIQNSPRAVILEMQGGGETSNTGNLTRHLANWRTASTNMFLREEVQGVGAIVTNAWRRQQEQFIVKGNVAITTGNTLGMVFCVGPLLYDHLIAKISGANLRDLRGHAWNLALMGYEFDETETSRSHTVKFQLDPTRLLFTNYQTFVQALINQSMPCPDIFRGEFISLAGDSREINFA